MHFKHTRNAPYAVLLLGALFLVFMCTGMAVEPPPSPAATMLGLR